MAQDGKTPQRDFAIPVFVYKEHAAIDWRYGFIRGWNVTGASVHDGVQLRNVLNRGNTGSTVWSDKDIDAIGWNLNATPGKYLGFETPIEAFVSQLDVAIHL